MTALGDYLRYLCGAENVRANEPLRKWTTFRVGGNARYLVDVPDKNLLPRLLSALTACDCPYFILGAGANVLASDNGYHGVVIRLTFRDIVVNDRFLYADAGARLGAVEDCARRHGLSGLEWATGIPATVGGAVYMNCGAFGGEMADVVVMVDALVDGKLATVPATALDFGYRHSVFQDQPAVILGAYFYLHPDDPDAIRARMREIAGKRAHHPRQPSAGSTFRRPHDGFYVGKTIEALGFKGRTVGGARVAPEHCGFIVNTGTATARDILTLIYQIQDAVARATHVTLTPEIIFLGEF